jgi:hypothetical protein
MYSFSTAMVTLGFGSFMGGHSSRDGTKAFDEFSAWINHGDQDANQIV